MITGGCTLNQMMIKYMGEEISGLIVPKEAPYFEALGAALWAVENETEKIDELSSLFNSNSASFDTLSPLDNFQNMVEFKTLTCSAIKPKDVCTLGLDVGSTTTKAVLIRNSDNAILA